MLLTQMAKYCKQRFFPFILQTTELHAIFALASMQADALVGPSFYKTQSETMH